MIRNYFIIAWRNIKRNKLFSAINIIGLSIGIATCSIIYLYLGYELSYDKYNEKAGRIFRLVTTAQQPTQTVKFARTSPPVAERIKANFPEVEDFVRFSETLRLISYKDVKLFDTKILYADSGLFDIFSLDLLQGDPRKALSAPYSIVVTESMAKRYFGNAQAFGKIMQFADTVNLTVTGVIKDLPANSHFTTDCFISANTRDDLFKNIPSWTERQKNWFECSIFSYLLLKENTDAAALEVKINAMLEREMAEVTKETGVIMHVKMQPLPDIHLESHLDSEFPGSVQGDIKYVYIFTGAAILILLIACCNFINLSTARSLNRSKEIGLRKVIGAGRSQLVSQFLGESMVFTVIATVLATLLVVLLVPFFNAFLGVPLSLDLSLLWFYLLLIFVVGIVAGLYPAILMSSFAPVKSLKGKIAYSVSDIILRKGLVVFQFTVTIVLIIGTSLILKQLDHIQKQNIGMNKEELLNLELKAQDSPKAALLLKELLRNPKVAEGSVNDFSFKGISLQLLQPEGYAENETATANVIWTDDNFLSTYQVKLATGRNFSTSFATDPEEAVMVNEAAVKEFGWKTAEEAIGKTILFGVRKKIVGVVKDFNFASLHENVKPLVIGYSPQSGQYVSLRLKTDDLRTTMKDLENTWEKIATQSPFTYSFIEEDFDNLYNTEKKIRDVLSGFTFLSILVACLGLFGLASFTIQRRFKEIGIRKVLGSGVPDIIRLLSKDFLKLVVISFLVASPISWYMISRWLQDYAYRTEIGASVFLFAGAAAFTIAFVTVSVQAAKAAMSNPIKSLRTE